ncbi:MAG TPA: prolipoprotein diacylglyceryl transferase [Clostridia bacterium]|nr:prolipoprotein diacylglyceryl transferase [Clostridia bacterium]
MNPVAFTFLGLEIHWYAILMVLSFFIAGGLVQRWGKEKGYKEEDLLDLTLVVILTAIVGARLYYVAFSWEHYQGDILKIINLRGGGLAIHGGIIGGLIGGYFFCKRRGLNFLELADFTAPGLILGQAIGRWGNFFNQEAYGGPTNLPWAITVAGEKVHPTFLYESLWNLGVFFILLRLLKKKEFDGQIILLHGILYSLGRLWIEGLRTDSLMLGPLRIAQVVSLGTIVLFSGFYFYGIKKKRN